MDLSEPRMYFKLIAKACIANIIIITLLSLQKDIRKLDKRYEFKNFLFIIGFLILKTAFGTGGESLVLRLLMNYLELGLSSAV